MSVVLVTVAAPASASPRRSTSGASPTGVYAGVRNIATATELTKAIEAEASVHPITLDVDDRLGEPRAGEVMPRPGDRRPRRHPGIGGAAPSRTCRSTG